MFTNYHCCQTSQSTAVLPDQSTTALPDQGGDAGAVSGRGIWRRTMKSLQVCINWTRWGFAGQAKVVNQSQSPQTVILEEDVLTPPCSWITCIWIQVSLDKTGKWLLNNLGSKTLWRSWVWFGGDVLEPGPPCILTSFLPVSSQDSSDHAGGSSGQYSTEFY